MLWGVIPRGYIRNGTLLFIVQTHYHSFLETLLKTCRTSHLHPNLLPDLVGIVNLDLWPVSMYLLFASVR